ncbi:MAG: GntR family transcriptional regulator [Shewanella sp.]|nr:GntR family transcriptional regulator [Shewanella sp.]MCF1431839.1 GntR family transcriptional regulator [Shewanella sp.]MCF1437707.1 GntR family transcriptional regulator [Shewanella sp.]MCF1456781.1 GntR family transcriptional regulator [Shewanella sp.]
MKITYKTRTQFVVDAIREKILSGELTAGQPLRQAALAEELDVSRIPVREALLQLEAEGLVKFQAHKGATVTELDADYLDELCDMRVLLETDLLARSVPNMTTADFDEAEVQLAALEQAFADGCINQWAELNTRFHLLLYKGAKRPQTMDIVSNLNKNADRYISLHLLLADGIKKSGGEHRQLIDLCRSGYIEQACSLLQDHIFSGRDEIKALLKDGTI